MVAADRLAPTGRRIVSFVIDDVVVSLLFVAIFSEQITALQSSEELRAFLQDTFWVLVLLKVIYHTLFTATNGMTFGKYLARIRTVSAEDGGPVGWGASFVRSAARVMDEFIFYLGFLPAFFSPTGQTLHDRIGGCVVVHA